MKAVRIHSYGGREVLALDEIPVPEPGDGEILVKVGAAAVNPVDAQIRQGIYKDMFGQTLPVTLGCDVAGTVEKAGAGVTGFKAGDEVYAFPALARCGAHAEYVVLKQDEAALKPKTLDFVQAASIPVAVLTAWQALFDIAGLTSKQTVLIHAASGGVGSMAVRLAKWQGARVIGTASGKNEEFVRGLGADEFIDYTKTKFEDVVHDVDVVLAAIGGDTQARSFQVLRKGGFLVTFIQPPQEELMAQYGVRAAMVLVKTNGLRLGEVARLVDEGVLGTHIETVLPLSEAARAHELVESGRTRGKIVLTATPII